MISFGPAFAEDVESLYEMVSNLIVQYEDFSSLNREKVLNWTRRSIETNLPHYSRVYRDGQLAGFFCRLPSEGKTELDNLFILPPFRGQGIGTAVLEKCIAESGGDLFFYVFRENRRAVSLYERMGFRVREEVGSTRYIMEYAKEGC